MLLHYTCMYVIYIWVFPSIGEISPNHPLKNRVSTIIITIHFGVYPYLLETPWYMFLLQPPYHHIFSKTPSPAASCKLALSCHEVIRLVVLFPKSAWWVVCISEETYLEAPLNMVFLPNPKKVTKTEPFIPWSIFIHGNLWNRILRSTNICISSSNSASVAPFWMEGKKMGSFWTSPAP